MAEAQVREQRRGRRWAMKALFMWDAKRGGEAEALVDEAIRMEAPPPARGADTATHDTDATPGREARDFACALVAGTVEHAAVIDAVLEEVAPAWGPGRMAAVDRALLRLGCYELMYGATQAGVTVSEVVDLARAYSTGESPAFVNGVLGAVAPRRPVGAKRGAGGRARGPRGTSRPIPPPDARRRGEKA